MNLGVFILVGLLLSVIFVVLTLIVSAGIALVGWVLSLIFPLSMVQGVIVAGLVGAGVAYLMYVFFRDIPLPGPPLEEEEDEWEEDEDEEDEPPIVPWRRRRPTPAPPSKSPKGKQ